MAKKDFDSMFEPIEFTLDKKDYVIERIDPDLMERVWAVDVKTDPITGVVKQFSMLTGVPEAEARKIDIRKIEAVIRHIMDAINPEKAAKNA